MAWGWLILPLVAALGVQCARIALAYARRARCAAAIDGELFFGAVREACRLRGGVNIPWPLAVFCAGLAVLAWLPFAFQPDPLSGARAIACCVLLALAIIDARCRLLPDALTQPLLWAGLLLAWAGVGVRLSDAVIATASAYLFLWMVNAGYSMFRGRAGLGGGDLKLAAALGAWLGWAPLPGVLLGACVAGIVFAFASRGWGAWRGSVALGPFLAAAGAVGLAGAPVVQWVFCSGVAVCSRWVSLAG